jgi:hypothetical protein
MNPRLSLSVLILQRREDKCLSLGKLRDGRYWRKRVQTLKYN